MDRDERATHRRETWETGVLRGGTAAGTGDATVTDALWWARATELERLQALYEMVRAVHYLETGDDGDLPRSDRTVWGVRRRTG
jgi:hypothetical protein